jgi:hypothetical protein
MNDVEVKERYQVEISNGASAVENTDDNIDLNGNCESIRDGIKTSTKGSLCYHNVMGITIFKSVQNY